MVPQSPYKRMPYKLPFDTTVEKTKHKQSEGLGRFNVGVSEIYE